MANIDRLVEQVISIDSSQSASDIRRDIEYTKSAELTLNRLLDGEFLQGIDNNNSTGDVLVILDSDEEEISPDNLTIDPSPSDTPETSIPQLHKKRPLELAKNDLNFDSKKKSKSVDNYTLRRKGSLSPTEVLDFQNTVEIDSPVLEIPHDLPIRIDDLPSKDNQITYEPLPPIIDKHKDKDMIYVPSHDEFLNDLLNLKTKISPTENDNGIKLKGNRKENEIYKHTPPAFERSFSETSFETLEPIVAEEVSLKEKRKQQSQKKKLEREALLEIKRREKEEKQKEKEKNMLFEKENRLKNNREEILKEMIVAIHPAFSSQKVGKLLESVLQSKMAEVTELLDTEQYAISWRRKCTAEWNTDSQSFIPLQKTEIIEEPFVLVYMHVEELIDRIQNNTVYRHIEKIQNAKKKYQVLLLVEGVEAYYKKRALLQKRLFENEVRKTINDPASATPKTSKKKKQVVSVDDLPSQESVEEYLNELQFMHDIMLVPTKSDDDTVSWIESLTTDLALGRYKEKNLNNAYKGIKSGSNPTDAYFKMLQEIRLCTPAIAKSIMKEYPTLQLLHRKYEKTESSQRNLLLSHLEVQRSALQARDRTVNKVMSKKICNIFNSDDPSLFLY